MKYILLLLCTKLCASSLFTVHGFFRSERNMTSIEKSFKKDGWDVVNFSYPSRSRCIEVHADELAHKLASYASEHPGEPINFVSHSLGGIIIRAALNHPACPKEAKNGRAVLIAPPNQGASFAKALYKWKVTRKILGRAAGKQLMLAPNFEHLGAFPTTMKVMVIAGKCGFNPLIPGANDGKVGVDETRLKTPHTHTTIFAGHSWICHTKETLKLTKQFMKVPK